MLPASSGAAGEAAGPPLLRHLRLLLGQRLRLKARDVTGTLFELLIPVALILVLVSIAQISQVLEIPANNYATIPRYNAPPELAKMQVLTDYIKNATMNGFNVDGQPIPIIPAQLRPCRKRLSSTIKLGGLAFAPRALAEPLVERLRASRQVGPWFKACSNHPLLFETEEDALQWAHNDTNSQDLWALVVVMQHDPATHQYEYKIRTRNNFVAQTPYLGMAVQPYTLGRGFAFRSYFMNGVVSLQHLLAFAAYCEASGKCESAAQEMAVEMELTALTVPFPVEDVRQNLFFKAATGFVPLVFVIAFIYPMSKLVKVIVEEREQRLKELMLMMGLHPTAYTWSWVVLSQLQVMASAVLTTYAFSLLYTHSEFWLLLSLILLYCTATAAVCFLIAGWFNRARTAVLGAVLLLFATEIPFLVQTDHPTYRTKLFLSLLPNMAFSYAMRHVGQAEAANTTPALDEGDFTIIHSMVFLTIDVFLYHFLAWYYSQVRPGEFGTPQKPWFLLTPSFWCPSYIPAANPDPGSPWLEPPVGLDSGQGPIVEPLSEAQRSLERVTVRGLRKVFDGNFVAVDGLDLALCEGSITVLLGHNGAGKTTTLNMLTGALPPTAGDAVVFGHSVRHNVHAVRRSLGVCPQQNVLWPQYTVEEHLRFFARLKGLQDGPEVEGEVTTMLRAVNLTHKARVYSLALSGGMKRRLCMGIALIGGSKLIFLDEPTAGMDPEAREQAHRLLLGNTKGRVIILSTHFMDEADKLGDRIAILSQGKVRCCGSPLFLKARLGVGYTLTLSLHAGAKPQPLANLIHRHVPSATCKTSSAMETSFLLKMDAVSQFGPLFRELEDRREDLQVATFGISMTRLEDVYLRIALEAEDVTQSDNSSPFVSGDEEDFIASDGPLLEAGSHSVDLHFEDPALLQSPCKLLPLQFYAMLLKRFHVARRDRWFQFCLMVLPVGVVIGALLLTELVAPNPALIYAPDHYPVMLKKPTEVVVADLAGRYDWPTWPQVSNFNVSNATGRSSLAMTDWLLKTALSHNVSRFGALVADDTVALARGGPVLMDTVMHNSTALHALPTFYAELLNVKLRRMLEDPGLSLTFVGHTLPMTARAEAAFNTLKLVGAAIIILFPFTFIPANFASFLVKERACKAKHVQVVSGVNLVVFWLATYLWDLLQFLLTVLLTLATFWAFDKKEYVGTAANLTATFALFMLYGMATTALAYACHFSFSNHTTSQTVLMLANLICGVVLVIASQIMSQVDSTKEVNSYLVHFYRLFPAYCLGEGLLNLSLPLEFFALVLQIHVSGPFDLHVAGRSLIYLAVEAPAFFALAMLCEFRPGRQQLSAALRRLWRPQVEAEWESPEEEDDDVQRERAVEAGDGRPADLVTVQRLCKEYPGRGNGPPLRAVKGLSFGVHEGEIFALLGVNGAGKTTTLSILSGEFDMTSGRALLNHHDISTDLQAARQGLGYCPQFDALLDLLTVEEHLFLYCRLRGIPPDAQRMCVERTMRHLGLQAYAHKVARKLSGGTRRKLSMAIALIGGPKVVFLDEPSAGMDPVARRSMCDAIAGAARGRAIILTTHHLEEVEALAHRVGIMVAGEFRCLGSLTHLKAKFGQGYWLEFRVLDPQKAAVIDFVRAKFGKAVVEEDAPGFLKLKVTDPSLRLSAVFEEVEASRSALQLQDYAVSQPTLEQVFLSISEMEEATRIRSDSTARRRPGPRSVNADSPP